MNGINRQRADACGVCRAGIARILRPEFRRSVLPCLFCDACGHPYTTCGEPYSDDDLTEATAGGHGDVLLVAEVIGKAHDLAAAVAAETTEARFLHGKTCGRQGRKPRKVRQALERQAVRTALAKHLEPYVTPPWWAPPGSLSPLVPQLEPDGSAVDWHAAKGHVGSLEGCADYWCFKKNGDDIRRSASAALSIGLLAAMKEDARREGAR